MHDFVLADRAGLRSDLLAVVDDHLLDGGVRNRVATTGFVAVPAQSRLLAEATLFAQPMSLPARSDMRKGPIAMPQLSSARSTWLGVAPSSSRNRAWRRYCSTMRLPMKPSHTPETTAVFLIFFARPITVARTSLAVFAPRTTSSSFITLAGLKKCVPTTS